MSSLPGGHRALVGCLIVSGLIAGRHYATVIAQANGMLRMPRISLMLVTREIADSPIFGGVNRGNRGPVPLIVDRPRPGESGIGAPGADGSAVS